MLTMRVPWGSMSVRVLRSLSCFFVLYFDYWCSNWMRAIRMLEIKR